MGYPKHYLLSFGGKFGATETWSCSVRMTSAGVAAFDDATMVRGAETSLDDVARAVEDYQQDLGALWHVAATLGFVKFNAIGPDGRYIGNQTVERVYQVEKTGQGSSSGPYQLSAVISLETGVNRGLAVSGRWFLPVPYLNIQPNGRMTDQNRLHLATHSQTFINSLNNWDGIDLPSSPNVCVVSRGKRLGPSTWGPGVFRRVTGVAVGNVLDTQRRRREQLKEEYVVLPVS